MAGIKVNLNGFDALLEQIQKAEGNLDSAALRTVEAGAKIAEDALRTECAASAVPASVTNGISTKITQNGNRTSAHIGWEIGAVDIKNPSAGLKAIFLNYGTPRGRYTKAEAAVPSNKTESGWATTTDRGKIIGRGFIGRAKKKARPKIKKAQEEALREILKGLE